VSCYELGHQPLSLASPLAALHEAGFLPVAVDTSVESLPDEAITAAKLVAISVPMHTALRLAEGLARRLRALNPAAHLNLYGLYAWLNADYLFGAGLADSAVGGEFEEPLVNLARAIEQGQPVAEGIRYPNHYAPPHIARQRFAIPSRGSLPGLDHYAALERDGRAVLAGYTEATRGCKHTCLHCPITPIYNGRFFAIPREIVLGIWPKSLPEDRSQYPKIASAIDHSSMIISAKIEHAWLARTTRLRGCRHRLSGFCGTGQLLRLPGQSARAAV